MRDGSKEALDRVSPNFMRSHKNSSMAMYLPFYGAGWNKFDQFGFSPGKCGQQKLYGINTFRWPQRQSVNLQPAPERCLEPLFHL